MKKYIFISILSLIASVSKAEIEKTAIPDEKCGTICFYWWPKLPTISGWHQDKEQSFNYSANTQAPDGYTFINAETVIYAKALYKPRIPETKSLSQLINDDQNSFKKGSKLVINPEGKILTADKKQISIYSFTPESNGNWEYVGYGEEGDFYLVFTISSRTQEGLNKNLPIFKEYINGYKENTKI